MSNSALAPSAPLRKLASLLALALMALLMALTLTAKTAFAASTYAESRHTSDLEKLKNIGEYYGWSYSAESTKSSDKEFSTAVQLQSSAGIYRITVKTDRKTAETKYCDKDGQWKYLSVWEKALKNHSRASDIAELLQSKAGLAADEVTNYAAGRGWKATTENVYKDDTATTTVVHTKGNSKVTVAVAAKRDSKTVSIVMSYALDGKASDLKTIKSKL